MPAGMTALVLGMLGLSDSEAVKPLLSRGDRAYAMAEARLAVSPFFAGDVFTAADIMMLFPLTTMRVFAPRDLGPYPNIRAYLTRIGQRPAFRSAAAKGDPDLAPMLS